MIIMNTYKKLIVWQKAMDLVAEMYKLVKLLPKEETYALSDQMRRAVVSIPSNIAEGQGRASTRDYLRFLSIARGSCFELDTQINACVKINYISENQAVAAFNLLNEISKMLTAIINKLKKEIPNP